MATIWGALSNVKWENNQGASGFDGLTLMATGSKGQSLDMTFTGMTTADLSHLAISTGSVGGTPDMLIANVRPPPAPNAPVSIPPTAS